MQMAKKVKIYVIGYPKSGTIWLVRLLAHSLDSSPYGGNRTEDSFFKEFYDRDGKYVIFHKHDKNLSNIDLNTSKIFYIIRDFRDVVVSSFFHHYNIDERLVLLSRYCNKKGMNRIFWRNIVFKLEINKLIRNWGSVSGGRSWLGFLHGILCLRWIKEIRSSSVGVWSSHVDFWTKGHRNVTVIRYEDLLKNIYRNLTNALYRLDISYSPEQVKEAVEQEQFRKRKNLLIEQANALNARHLRKGVSGDWKRFLDKHMLRLIKLRHGSTMNKFGYKL